MGNVGNVALEGVLKSGTCVWWEKGTLDPKGWDVMRGNLKGLDGPSNAATQQQGEGFN